MKRSAVFLDRDGVLNRAIVRNGAPYSPLNVSDFDILPGVDEALADLRRAGFHLVVITNQPELARGRLSADACAEMHDVVRQRLGVSDIRMCPHDDGDGCACRKPKPGMLLEAAQESQLDLGSSFTIGDRWRDIVAGQNAGTRTVLIDCGYNEALHVVPDYRAGSLREAVSWILSTVRQSR